jgi:macrodomain Ter protein organizer (MatP/YcbG family)
MQPKALVELEEADGGDVEALEPENGQAKGRGAVRKPRKADTRVEKRTGRTVYIPDDIWERVIVQSHRRRKTCSDYITGILERAVPDHRKIVPDATDAA